MTREKEFKEAKRIMELLKLFLAESLKAEAAVDGGYWCGHCRRHGELPICPKCIGIMQEQIMFGADKGDEK